MSKVSSISWAANEFGYVVQWFDEQDELIDQYHAGNHKLESTTYVKPESPNALPVSLIRAMAQDTALEKARSNGLSPDDVSEDADLAHELADIYRSFGPEEDDGEKESEASSGSDSA